MKNVESLVYMRQAWRNMSVCGDFIRTLGGGYSLGFKQQNEICQYGFLTMVSFPLNCFESIGDGFSGWYAVSDKDSCKDFCFWELNEQFSVYNSTNTANPHETTHIPGTAIWRCATDVSDDSITWDLAFNTSLSRAGEYGEKFDFLRCNRGAKEILNSTADKLEASENFWISALLIISLLVCLELYYFVRNRTSEPKFSRLRHDSSDAAETSETGFSNEFSEPPESDDNIRPRLASRTQKIKQVMVILLLIAGNFALFYLGGIAIMSFREVTGTVLSPSQAKFTPACSSQKNECSNANKDIDNPSVPTESKQPFSYLIASDSQLDWWSGESATLGTRNYPLPCSPSDSCSSCTKKAGHYTNNQLRKAFELLINDKEGDVQPNSLVMNGDLTAYFQPSQRKAYESIYHNITGLRNYFPSLGNHDYHHLDGGRYQLDQGPWGEAYCNAEHAIGYFRGGLCGHIPKFDPKRIVRYDSQSLAYSWEEGRYHFVHLHYFPTYENAKLGIRNSLQWLERDLILALEEKMVTIIFVHAAQGLDHTVENIILGKNVVAIFAGHSHRCFHRKCTGLRVLSEKEVTDPNSTKLENAKKCIPGEMALCGGMNSQALVYVKDLAANFTVPERKIHAWHPSKKGDLCPQPNLKFVNETDNTLWCRESVESRTEFPFHDNSTEKIPIFWSGSSSFETFLQVKFYNTKFVVRGMTATAGSEGRMYTDIYSVPSAVYPHHETSDLEEVIIQI